MILEVTQVVNLPLLPTILTCKENLVKELLYKFFIYFLTFQTFPHLMNFNSFALEKNIHTYILHSKVLVWRGFVLLG